MGASERQAAKMKSANDNAARSFDDFSKRVRRNIQDLEFQTAQLKRSAAEQQRYEALRRAGVAATSAEGVAITNAVRALQTQQAALGKTAEQTRRASEASREFASQWARIGAIFVGTVGAGAILKAADAFTAFTNQLKVAGIGGNTLAAVQERLFAMANKNGVEISSLGTLYGRLALSSKELGVDQNRLLEFTEGVTAALRVQGGNASQASGALLQLSQAMGSGIVRAEEFNSILEGAQPIAQAVANGMEGIGGSIAKLRAKILEGTVTSKMFFEAAMKGFEETKRQAQGSSLTIGQSLTSLENSFIKYIGTVDAASGASTALASAISSIGKAMDTASQQSNSAGGGRFDKLFDIGAMIRQDVKDIERLMDLFKRLEKAVSEFASNAGSYVTEFLDNLSVEGARASATFIEMFKSLPEALGDVFANAWSFAKSATAEGINELTAVIANSKVGKLLGLEGGTNLDTSITLRGSDGAARSVAAGQAAADEVRAQIEAARQAQFSQQQTARRGTSTMGDVINSNIPNAGANATAAAGKEAQNAAKKYSELTMELELTKAAQDKMTEAAGKGSVAFQEMEAMLAAQQKALDIFGKKLDDNDPKLLKLRDLMLSIAQGKAAESFATATTELNNQNAILEKQIALMGQAPEIIAKEIAMIKARQEAEKGGTAITQEAIEARRVAIEQNETLKNQAEELKKAQELWTAPLKSALESIQQTAADAFETMLESGKINFQELGNVFKKIVLRMAAEFMSLALLRPVMNVVVNAVGGGSGGGLGSGNVSGGSGGLGDLLSSVLGNSGGGSSIGDMLGIGGMFGTSVGTAGGITTVGPPIGGYTATLGANGLGTTTSAIGGSMNGATASGGLTGSLGGAGSAMGMIGGAFGVGMGALSLASGGTKTTKGTIAGVGQMVGGALMMIPTGYTQIIGAVIMALSSILPGLLGDENKIDYDREYGELGYGSSGFFTTGGAWGMEANAKNLEGPLSKVGENMDAVFRAFGGVKEAGKVWGIALQSYKETYSAGGSFANATSFLVGPNGERQQWGMGSLDSPGDIGMESAAVTATINSVLGGAVGEISKNMRKAIADVNESGKATFQSLSTVIAEIMAFDEAIKNFGKTTTEAEQQIKAVDESFNELYNMAAKYALAADTVAKIDAERARLRLKATEDFTFSISQSLLGFTNPLQAQLNSLEKEKQAALDTNDAYLRLVENYSDQRLNIERLYQLQRNELIEAANAEALAAQRQANAAMANAAASSLGNLQALIRQLTPGGALSGLDPAGQLAGLRASYDASFAQASSDPTNADAISRFTSNAQAFLEYNRSFTGGSTAYAQSVSEALQRSQGLQIGVTQGAMNMTADAGTHSRLDALLAAVNNDNVRTADQNVKIDTLIDLLVRYVSNQQAA